ncbi:hypothetical protein JAAARDRAFT_201256 [Jaapia argillacea MUCL 33604]|uniref:Uncharacterized protein n=1 Tax=Jaapia argillacea MUCL 33604 TaxID=933084 RepID=A0A067PD92_9AGAM|nr:hypothetical protein JAAARDRAFT_201256 [Jaapia argillacea MUCL 33604]
MPRLQACIGFPTQSEIANNLSKIHTTQTLWQDGNPPPHRGYSLMVDEIAVDPWACYDGSRDVILGFPHEDTASYNLTNAKEATVAAISAYDRIHYTAIPILISGTSKKETEGAQAIWIELLIDQYYNIFEPNYGPLDSVASDGDATHRRALFCLLMSTCCQTTTLV